MKKNLVIVAIIGLVIATLSGCGSESGSGSTSSEGPKGISDKEKKELVETNNYKKACELKDFSTAYEIVDNLKEVANRAKVEYEEFKQFWRDEYYQKWENANQKAKEAERYVVLQEALLVLESEGTNGLMRIVGIGKEHNAESWLYPELLDVAKKIGDTDLANRIKNIMQSNNSNVNEAEDDMSEEIEEPAPAQPTPKKSVKSKRRRR